MSFTCPSNSKFDVCAIDRERFNAIIINLRGNLKILEKYTKLIFLSLTMEIECFFVMSRYNPFKAYDLLYVPPALTFRNSVFCPQRI
jgi:hypothetical protein